MGELLETVEFEHQPLVEWLVPWVVRVPELCPFGVKVYLVTQLGWQCSEKTVRGKVVVPILHIIRRVGWREWSVVSCHFFRKVHFSWGPWFVWSQGTKVSEMTVWSEAGFQLGKVVRSEERGPALLLGNPRVTMAARAPLRGSGVSTGWVYEECSRGAAGGFKGAQLLGLGPQSSPVS